MDFPTFELDTQEEGGRTRVHLSGDLDLAALSEVNGCLLDLEARGRSVLLDIRDVTFMVSTALGFLIGLHRSASDDGWSLAITTPGHDAVRRLFDIVDLQRVLPLSRE
jgi:anti-anti-sigma factor